ncbi:MAG TPA: DUF3825 domain-containing protein [Chitinophagaceae bacterium]|jgi:hypothetical protein|nr:DUF3825 domain-containing protein [Chitinophagaceae bacterium]
MLENSSPHSRPLLLDHAYLADVNVVIEKLRVLAAPDKWDYSVVDPTRPSPILKNYLYHTFHRLHDENKVLTQGAYICFNTGLITENQQEIFMFFKQFPGRNKWTFIEFCNESDSNLNRFSPLPERASYFTDHSELTFDTRLQLRINIDHIIDDRTNFQRFDPSLQALSKQHLMNTFNGAIEHAKKRLKRNYKTAIPQFYRGKNHPFGHLQLLLPLCFTDPSKADLALAVYKIKNGVEHFYSGRTCLTLDMAINNARLITRPDDEWLRP